MGVLSVGAFDGKGVFLPVVDGGFPVADFGGSGDNRYAARRDGWFRYGCPMRRSGDARRGFGLCCPDCRDGTP